MQYSTNYNLNLVEGTDIVNPLVIDKPNYITIDTQMKDNENAGVGTATEIKTGTVHALTRSNGDNNVFRYVATSVCNAGDTFTVDGVSVTALLPTGEALANNSYTIGCNVLAILTSTELTIFTGGGTASNAAMLNNQLPSYYLDARNESFDNTGTDLTATNTENAIKEVNTKVSKLNSINDSSIIVDPSLAILPTFVNGSNSGYGTFYFKEGALVQLSIRAENVTPNSLVTIFNLPAGYRPIKLVSIHGEGGGSGINSSIQIYTNGEVKCYTPDGYSFGNITYFAGA